MLAEQEIRLRVFRSDGGRIQCRSERDKRTLEQYEQEDKTNKDKEAEQPYMPIA